MPVSLLDPSQAISGAIEIHRVASGATIDASCQLPPRLYEVIQAWTDEGSQLDASFGLDGSRDLLAHLAFHLVHKSILGSPPYRFEVHRVCGNTSARSSGRFSASSPACSKQCNQLPRMRSRSSARNGPRWSIGMSANCRRERYRRSVRENGSSAKHRAGRNPCRCASSNALSLAQARRCDVPLDQFETLQMRLAARFNGDTSVHDLPRAVVHARQATREPLAWSACFNRSSAPTGEANSTQDQILGPPN